MNNPRAFRRGTFRHRASSRTPARLLRSTGARNIEWARRFASRTPTVRRHRSPRSLRPNRRCPPRHRPSPHSRRPRPCRPCRHASRPRPRPRRRCRRSRLPRRHSRLPRQHLRLPRLLRCRRCCRRRRGPECSSTPELELGSCAQRRARGMPARMQRDFEFVCQRVCQLRSLLGHSWPQTTATRAVVQRESVLPISAPAAK